MTHLIISREYPPSAYTRGGIGTYVEHVARLLAESGETVHVIGEQFDGAPRAEQSFCDGRLVVHRVPLGRPLHLPTSRADPRAATILDAMARSEFPAQSFSWQSALLAEFLVETEGIDVIEAQDYEAPLYYFLTRRALGLGPDRRPPCVVHLHSPWEFVCHYNGWGIRTPYDLTIKRLEDHVIRSADALLCPSRYLASQAVAHYALDAATIERIPYPVGDTPFIDRRAAVLEHGTICYVGRLEPRKGVLEWMEAAIAIAADRPELRFEFVGADTSLTGVGELSVRAALEAIVPPELRRSFTFVGAQPRAGVMTRLADARLAVVPSRWENFPNTCVEAMSSGLPVLASPYGGMAEMVEHGRTGWIADGTRPADLLRALRHALDTPAHVRAEMGRAAATAIRRLCDNTATIDAHLQFRARVARQGAHRSLRWPSLPTWVPLADPGGTRTRSRDGRHHPVRAADARSRLDEGEGVAVVVLDAEGCRLDACLESIRRQRRAPSAVVVMAAASRRDPADPAERVTGDAGWKVLRAAGLSAEAARHSGIRAVLEGPTVPRGIAVLDAHCRLESSFVEACETVFDTDARVGLVSSWLGEGRNGRQIAVRPAAALPYQWLIDDVGPCCAFRTSALLDLEWVHDAVDGLPAVPDLALGILAADWLAVTYPAVLCRSVDHAAPARIALAAAARRRFRLALQARAPGQVERDAPLLLQLLQAGTALDTSAPRPIGRGALAPDTLFRLPHAEQLALVRRALRSPRYTTGWLLWHGRRALESMLSRLSASGDR
jgi:glycogen(starch) synthase